MFNSSIFIFYVLEAESEAFNLGCVVNVAWTLLEIHSPTISGEWIFGFLTLMPCIVLTKHWAKFNMTDVMVRCKKFSRGIWSIHATDKEVKQRHEKTIERNKLLMKENAPLHKKLWLLRLQLKEQAVPAARPLGLEPLAQIVTSMEWELQAETHQEEITSLVREKGASSKKPWSHLQTCR